MKYRKTTWKTGDEITAARMNNMEEGIEAANSTETEILPEQDVPFSSFGSSYIAESIPLSSPISIGQYYTVYWNGSVHTCKCVYGADGGGLIVQDPILGNLTLMDSNAPDTEEPFLIIFGGTAANILTNEAGENQRIGIFLVDQVITEQIKAEAADEGKFLRVVNGKAAWVALTDVSKEGV